MNEADKQRVQAFLEKWQGSKGNERANYQTFFGDLCVALGVDSPPPKGNVPGDPYCFDKDIKFYTEKKETVRFADFYKEGCFLMEAKQGSDSSSKGHGKRGTKAYRDAMQNAFNQARMYAYNRMLSSMPPFLLTCDIGSHFEIWEGFSGDYGSYGARKRVNLNDLKQPEVFDRFVNIFTDPQSLNPEKYRARVTREVATELAKLSRWLEEENHDPEAVANFLMRCIFTMFAEDVELLKGEVFTKALRDRWIPDPTTFKSDIEDLWEVMNTGGKLFGYGQILQFNGSFFEAATAFDLPKEQLEVLYAAAAKDWSEVEPAIFGTLLERALDKKERSRLGAHYTPRSYVERLVRPVIIEPLRQEWDEIELEVKRLLEPAPGKDEPTPAKRRQAEGEIQGFLDKLRSIKILDPACGTGNFLYVSLDLLKGLEQEVITRLVDVVGEVQLGIEQINPSQFLGIEINPRASAIAELVIWIGYLQWYFKRYGNAEPPEPVLQAFGNIECRDAVLAYDGKEPDVDPKTGEVRTRWGGRMMKHPVTGEDVPDPSDQVVIYRYLNPRPAEWQEADYIVSNPPFIGNRIMRELLGDGYTESLRKVYSDISNTVDYVMYWWHKSALLTRVNKVVRFGLITTNSISQVRLRNVIESHLDNKRPIKLFFAIPDHPWVDGGASVRIAMTGCEAANKQTVAKIGLLKNEKEVENPEEKATSIDIQWQLSSYISADLRTGVDTTSAISLKAQSGLCFDGVKPYGSGFTVPSDQIKAFPKIEREILKSYINGRDLAQKSRGSYVIDCFGLTEDEVRERFPSIYNWLINAVYPERKIQKNLKIRTNWWLFERNRPDLRLALQNLNRYIVGTKVSKHRYFAFVDRQVIPDQKVIAIAVDDAYSLGVLSSNVHVTWALTCGSHLGPTPVYSQTLCFDPFPFPDPTPEQKQKIRELGERLDAHRKQVQANHPEVTITGMYNLLEKLRNGESFTDEDREYNNKALVSTLKQIHDQLDVAVLEAYGWEDLIPLLNDSPQSSSTATEGESKSLDDIILERLVALNAERAEEERNGTIRWLRPEYQAPDEVKHQQITLEGVTTAEEPVVEPVQQQKWSTKPKQQLAAIRDLLRNTPGDWTVKQIAAQFKGRTTQKRLEAITENLERLEWFGMVIPHEENGITYWQYTNIAQTA